MCQPSEEESYPEQLAKTTERKAKVWLQSLSKYPSDPAQFRHTEMTAELRAEIINYGPCPPKEIMFPNNSKDRCFHESWYWKNSNKRDWLNKIDWPKQGRKIMKRTGASWKSYHQRSILGQTINSQLQEELIRERQKTLSILDRIFSATFCKS